MKFELTLNNDSITTALCYGLPLSLEAQRNFFLWETLIIYNGSVVRLFGFASEWWWHGWRSDKLFFVIRDLSVIVKSVLSIQTYHLAFSNTKCRNDCRNDLNLNQKKTSMNDWLLLETLLRFVIFKGILRKFLRQDIFQLKNLFHVCHTVCVIVFVCERGCVCVQKTLYLFCVSAIKTENHTRTETERNDTDHQSYYDMI